MQHDLTIRHLPVATLVPYAKNARTHSAAQVKQIAASIQEFGFNNPILLDAQNSIVAGHGRVLAAQSLGLATVPTISLGHLTEAQVKAFRLADNRIALSSGWDEAMLSVELGDLRAAGVDLSTLGFESRELNKLLTGSGQEDGEDEVPPPPAVPVTQAGDLWELDGHRIICGDAEDAATVARLLRDEVPSLMVTDPPYGVSYDPSWRNDAGVPKTKRTGVVANDHRADWRKAWALFPGAVAYVWHGALHAATVADSLTATGFEIRSQIIWAKERLILSRGHYHWQHEPAWYASRGGKATWAGDRKQTTLWAISSRAQDQDTEHGTQKPVECMRRPMENSSMPGDAVYEPFSGSGTSIIAAETTKRRCFAVELMPAYVDVAVLRWQAFAKKEARLAGDGRTFAEVAAARAAARAKPEGAAQPKRAPRQKPAAAAAE